MAASSVGDASLSAPSVDDASRRICKDSVYFQGPQQDFVTRQQTFELAKQRRQELRSQHADAKCTFKPEISDTSRQIVSGNVEYVGETTEENQSLGSARCPAKGSSERCARGITLSRVYFQA